jgi:hypothetical protein
MNQMKIDEAFIVPIDYLHEEIPTTVRAFKPILFREGNAYCCILGPDPLTGILGFGDSKEQALIDWDNCLVEHLDDPSPNETAKYILDYISASANGVW